MTKSTAMLSALISGIAAVVPAGFTAQAPAAPPAPPCVAGREFVCGQQGPEDLAVLPGGAWVLATSMSGTGALNLIRVADRTTTAAYPSPSARNRLDAKTYAACPGPLDEAKPSFRTHGLSFQPGANGVHRLFVVAHGPRESIEVFEVDARQGTPTFSWLGCSVVPTGVSINSVSGLPDGGAVVTNFNQSKGELWEWHPGGTWEKVPGSEGPGPNGLEISKDGRWYYIGGWGSQSFIRLSRGQTPPVRTEVPLGFRVDNLRWANDGTLIAAGQGLPTMPGWAVVKVDPQTLSVREITRQQNTPAFTGASVALEVGKELWIGTFRGDRIVTMPSAP